MGDLWFKRGGGGIRGNRRLGENSHKEGENVPSHSKLNAVLHGVWRSYGLQAQMIKLKAGIGTKLLWF